MSVVKVVFEESAQYYTVGEDAETSCLEALRKGLILDFQLWPAPEHVRQREAEFAQLVEKWRTQPRRISTGDILLRVTFSLQKTRYFHVPGVQIPRARMLCYQARKEEHLLSYEPVVWAESRTPGEWESFETFLVAVTLKRVFRVNKKNEVKKEGN